jgi:hypothetical protein
MPKEKLEEIQFTCRKDKAMPWLWIVDVNGVETAKAISLKRVLCLAVDNLTKESAKA